MLTRPYAAIPLSLACLLCGVTCRTAPETLEHFMVRTAESEAHKRWGWSQIEVHSVMRVEDGWRVTLWRIPKMPGGYVDITISCDGNVTAVRPGY
jgi:hypothetical protein